MKDINQRDLKKILQGHERYLRDPVWHLNERADFTDCVIHGANFPNANLKNSIFRNVKFSSPVGNPFANADLTGADFTGAELSGIYFWGAAKIDGAIFVNADVTREQFSPDMYRKIYLTEKEVAQAKEIDEQKIQLLEAVEEVNEKDVTIKQTSDKAVEEFADIFEELCVRYSYEERVWLLFVGTTFLAILGLATFPILMNFGLIGTKYAFGFYLLVLLTIFFALSNWVSEQFSSRKTIEKNGDFFDNHPKAVRAGVFALIFLVVGYLFSPDNYSIAEKVNFSFGNLAFAAPLEIVLSIFLYFSVVQYSRAKKLRIEQRNKLALIRFYVAFRANGTPEHMDLLLPKFADVLIREAMPDKNSSDKNLPIDEMIKIAELAVKNK